MRKMFWVVLAAFVCGVAMTRAAFEAMIIASVSLPLADTLGGDAGAIVSALTERAMLLPMAMVWLLGFMIATIVLALRVRRLRSVLKDRIERFQAMGEAYHAECRHTAALEEILEQVKEDRNDLNRAVAVCEHASTVLTLIRERRESDRRTAEAVIHDRRPIREDQLGH